MAKVKPLIRFDWAIKKILRHKADYTILEGFISELLSKDIKIRTLLESEGNKEDKEDKYNRVDLLVEDETKDIFIVEVQNTTQQDYFQRLLYGTSKVITEYMQKGAPYKDIKKVYAIGIVYFDLGQGEDYVYEGKTIFKGKHVKDNLQLSDEQRKIFDKRAISDVYPEYHIIKVNQFDDVAKDTLDEWIYYLKNCKIKKEFKAKGLKEANKKLQIMEMSDKEQAIYKRYIENQHYWASMVWQHEYYKNAAEEEKRKAEEEKRKAEEEKRKAEEAEKKAEIQRERLIDAARMLLQSRIPIQEIQSQLQLTDKEVRKLKKENL